MSELNQTSMRAFLVAVLKVDPAYVVPKQGNWWNPQVRAPAPKPTTWCAYRIGRNEPVDLPHYEAGVDGSEAASLSVQHKVATVDLQFVGDAAEDLANSVGHWTHRSDVLAALMDFSGVLLPEIVGPYSQDFDQEGANVVLSYNVTVRIAWASIIVTDQMQLRAVNLGKGVIHADL